MKKKFLLFTVSLSLYGVAQVGINTTDPKVTLNVNRNNNLGEEAPQGILFPKFSTIERTKFKNTPEGTLIYNTTKKCIEMYKGIENGVHQWHCLPDASSSQAQSIAVTSQGFEGAYVGGFNFNGSQKVKFKLENNSFSEVNSVFGDAVTIQNGAASINITECKYQKLTGGTPTGNEMDCSSGAIQLLSGESALLKYKLTGQPETGTLKAEFNKLGAQADQSIAVGLGSADISNKDHYVVSMVYNSTTVQGKINNGAEKVTLKIPYTNGKGNYNAVSITQTTATGQDNDTNELTLNIQPDTFNAEGNLTATIEVGGDGEYLVRQMEPGKDYDIATFNVDMNGNTFQIVLKGIGGILDNQNGGKYVYIPVIDRLGRTWLNNNVCSNYSNMNHYAFNPAQTAKSYDDEHAIGVTYRECSCPNGFRQIEQSDLKSNVPVTGIGFPAGRIVWIESGGMFQPTPTHVIYGYRFKNTVMNQYGDLRHTKIKSNWTGLSNDVSFIPYGREKVYGIRCIKD